MKQITRKYKLAPGEIIPLNMDFMFTTIFNKEENIDILENFISCYLEILLNKVKRNLKLIKRKLDINNKNELSNEVDLIFNYEDKTINIELSNERYQWELAKLSPSEYYIYVTTGEYPIKIGNSKNDKIPFS